jgi:hypothetical protein
MAALIEELIFWKRMSANPENGGKADRKSFI